ncbi:hypothetical protein BDL97_01G031500 [Sphagnum fallax]|nr:hypothetical protein BDL97_01G031500 [Sphagnum fallax]
MKKEMKNAEMLPCRISEHFAHFLSFCRFLLFLLSCILLIVFRFIINPRIILVTIRKHWNLKWNPPFVSHCWDVRLLLSLFVVSSSRHCVRDSSLAHLMCRGWVLTAVDHKRENQ